MGCIFCKIASGETPARVVYEDEDALAFEDIAPQSPVHVLVIPKKHISTLNELEDADNALVGHLFQVAQKVARQRGVEQSGYRCVMNCNADAGQTVFHIHLHVMGGKPMHWPPWPNL